MPQKNIELTGPKGSLIAAALALATERPWRDVSLRDVAERAGMPLVDVREHFASKAELLAGFVRAVDAAVLASAPAPQPDEPRRDVLFEVLMARFDALQPYKTALKSISADAGADPGLMRSMLASQGWMLQAAGVDSGGLEGGAKVAGLAAVYASVYRTWLDDDDPGMARTMATLDRRLRRGERTLSNIGEMGRTVRGIADWIAGGFAARGSGDAADKGHTASPTNTEPHTREV